MASDSDTIVSNEETPSEVENSKGDPLPSEMGEKSVVWDYKKYDLRNLIKNVKKNEDYEKVARAFDNETHQAEAEKIELKSRAQFISLRGEWSSKLITWISGLLLFHVFLTIFIGIKWLDFTAYTWFLPMVVAENFLQIVAMGLVIVKFLYPQQTIKK